MRMHTIAIFGALLVGFAGATAMGEESKPAAKTSDQAVEAMTKPEKKSGRRKKVEMCGECGKPETECECHGHDKDKKAEKKN